MDDDIRFMWDTPVPMRDGVKLSADIYLPAAEVGYPVILLRTPYDNIAPRFVEIAQYFSGEGYVVVIQDVRGRFDSEGHFEPRVNEGKDGYDTIEWIAGQPWSNGKIGMMGVSYGGTVQWLAARERPPHLVTVVSTATGGMRWMHDENYMNGKFPVFQFRWLNMTGGRTMQHYPFEPLSSHQPGVASPYNFNKIIRTRPLKDVDKAVGRTNTYWRTWLEHNTYDEYWQQMSFEDYFDKVDIPTLHITGWFDNCQWGELYMYNQMVARSPARGKQWLLIGPWDHAGTSNPQAQLGDLTFTQEAVPDLKSIHLRWFDHWLKDEDNGHDADSKVKIFTMGKNVWREEESWPMPNMKNLKFYLHSGGRANTFEGDGTLDTAMPRNEPSDHYVYDPEDPVPSVLDPESPLPPTDVNVLTMDYRYAQHREDTVVYSSAPLKEELEVTGTAFITLYAASDCVDTDWIVLLCIALPDGKSIPISSAVMRASYRAGAARIDSPQPSPISPGEVYRYTIEFLATSMVFRRGQRLSLVVTSSLYPAYDLNPNTGAPIGEDVPSRLANQTIYHNAKYPSHILLPVATKT
ncbi:MAG: CocE/NonD family hydrolase [Candidatus Poribacteria bacterium]|nr:CocE/NonD family hydrolase [Candidatus Poribacteria bacterium]MDE0506284.1 CocE/NonD family hydrolase [Candidatus Poribacteria bacterium]